MKNIFSISLLLFTVLSLSAQERADLEIVVDGLRNSEGHLRITLFDSDNGFPEDTDKAYTSKSIDLSKEKPVFRFENLKKGDYAYAILHDEDDNGKMKKNLIGIPKEGFGFSQNYRPKVGQPEFKDASVYLSPGKNRHVIEIVYFL